MSPKYDNEKGHDTQDEGVIPGTASHNRQGGSTERLKPVKHFTGRGRVKLFQVHARGSAIKAAIFK